MAYIVNDPDNRWNVRIDGVRVATVELGDACMVRAFRDMVADVSDADVTVSSAMNDEGTLVTEVGV